MSRFPVHSSSLVMFVAWDAVNVSAALATNYEGCGRLEWVVECLLFRPDDSLFDAYELGDLGEFQALDRVWVSGELEFFCPGFCYPTACLPDNIIGSCEGTGACCNPDGVCMDNVDAAVCWNGGGVYQGEGVECSEVTCNPEPVPTISTWGCLIMALLVVTAGTLLFRSRRAVAA